MEIKYIGLNGLQCYDSEIKDYIAKQIQQFGNHLIISADSYLQFPIIGDASCLYIDISGNKTYRWDDANLKYFVIGSNYNDITIINGTGK